LIDGWLSSGDLPHLAALIERGCRWRTGGPDLLFEHGAWVSITSGVPRARHGYHYLRQIRSGTYDLHLPRGCEAGAPPFWASLDPSRRILIADVPETRPLPGHRGSQLCEWAVHDPEEAASAEPASLLGDVRLVFGPQSIIAENYNASLADDKDIHRRLMDRVERKGRLLRAWLGAGEFDLGFFTFGESHTGAHQLWKYSPHARFEDKVEPENELANGIRDIYRAIDREIGALIEAAPDDANVIVLSSVGLKESYPTGGLAEAFCRELGYQPAPEPSAQRPSPIDIARRIIPEAWRVAISRRLLSREARERIVAQQFRTGTDWSRATAFAAPSHYAGFLRVNLHGREPLGIVEPGAEYEDVLRRLEEDLGCLRDPRSGRPAVRAVIRTDEVYGLDRSPALPDLFVEWEPAPYFIERLVHPKAELTQPRPEFFRGTDHTATGFVAAAGASIGRRGDLGEIDVLRLAPTFLRLLGAPRPSRMPGEPVPL